MLLVATTVSCGMRSPLVPLVRDASPADERVSSQEVFQPETDRPDVAPEGGTPDLVGRGDGFGDLPTDWPSETRTSDTSPRGDLPGDGTTDVPSSDSVPDHPVERTSDLRSGRDTGFDLVGDLQNPDGDALGGACTIGSTLSCVCDNGLSGTEICLPKLVYSECGCGTDALMRVRNGVIGTWTGTAAAFGSSWPVTFTFDTYTHYSAEALQGTIPALYYGSDEDSNLKRYDITDLQANGDGLGTIVIYFSGNSTSLETLQGIELSADGNGLRFYFMHGTAGPLTYALQRATP